MDKKRCCSQRCPFCFPLQVLRAGYSALAPDAWIRPHVGATNKKLKLHLGLVVPSATSCGAGAEGESCPAHQAPLAARLRRLPRSFSWLQEGAGEGPDLTAVDLDACAERCAFFRIGHGAQRTRCWQEGEVLLLDDSFEHEVFNACASERVVLQLVAEHPAYTAQRRASGQSDGRATLPVVTNG